MHHINLYVEGSEGGTQPVEVEPCGASDFRVLYTPGFVEGIAAGDLIRLTDEDRGYFDVLERGGNIALKWGSPSELGGALMKADELLSDIGARRDGAISNAAVWTVPLTPGFNAIEEKMNLIVGLVPDSYWWYGNVYDESDEPLNWW